jgi:hypothetical protein
MNIPRVLVFVAICAILLSGCDKVSIKVDAFGRKTAALGTSDATGKFVINPQFD